VNSLLWLAAGGVVSNAALSYMYLVRACDWPRDLALAFAVQAAWLLYLPLMVAYNAGVG
jgi:hypothetical protein